MSYRYFYDSKKGRFFKLTKSLLESDKLEEIGSFDDLNALVNGNYRKVDFNDFDFEGVDISKLDLTDARIPTAIQKKLGIFDGSFYENNITIAGNEDLSISKRQLATLEHECTQIQIYEPESRVKTPYRLFYITDLHLDKKLIERFPEEAATWEVRQYLAELISVMKRDFNKSWKGDDYSFRNYILIGGDVSHHYGIVKAFYYELIRQFGYYRVLAILGNHELWDSPNLKSAKKPEERLNTVVGDYERMFDKYSISFAHNMLYSLSDRSFIRGSELLEATDEEIREYCTNRQSLILGGIGFAGKTDLYNKDIGLYKDTVVSREQEVEQSEQFERIYNRLLAVIPDLTLIVFTHMPMECWSTQKPRQNWIYIHGHTHHNRLVEDNGALVYGDNQIGYSKKTFHLKSILLEWSYDTFRDYEDGIHTITNDQYLEFYRGQNISCTCNRSGTYYLVKKGGIRMFILRNKSGNLMIMDGGQIKGLSNHDIEYYYQNLEAYAEAVRDYVSEYRRKLEEISAFVKAWGGDGTIHGSIVDISFMDHLFLNPFDGSVIPYHAYDMVYKTVYSDLKGLLKEHHPEKLEEYKKLSGEQPTALTIPTADENLRSKGHVEYYDTWIYRCSRIFKKIQYLADINIIRMWNDKLLSNKDSRNNMVLEMLGISGLIGR